MQTTAVIICAVHAAKFAGARAVLDEMLLPALKLRVGVGSAVIRRSRHRGFARHASAVNKLEGVQMPISNEIYDLTYVPFHRAICRPKLAEVRFGCASRGSKTRSVCRWHVLYSCVARRFVLRRHLTGVPPPTRPTLVEGVALGQGRFDRKRPFFFWSW